MSLTISNYNSILFWKRLKIKVIFILNNNLDFSEFQVTVDLKRKKSVGKDVDTQEEAEIQEDNDVRILIL